MVLQIYEVGGGTGTCASDVLTYFKLRAPNVYKTMTYTWVSSDLKICVILLTSHVMLLASYDWTRMLLDFFNAILLSHNSSLRDRRTAWDQLKQVLYLHHGRSVEISAALARKQKARVGAVKSHSGHFMVNCGSASDPRTWGTFLPFYTRLSLPI